MKSLREDQYNRAIGKVQTSRSSSLLSFRPFSRKDVSVELTKRGLATLYTGGGAEYDGNRQLLEQEQQRAKKRKLGIFSNGDDNIVSPAEYKRQQKALKNQQKQQQQQPAFAVP